MRQTPGDGKFKGETAHDIGDRVQYDGTVYEVGGIARTSTGFVYMLRVPGSRAQVFAPERMLTAAP